MNTDKSQLNDQTPSKDPFFEENTQTSSLADYRKRSAEQKQEAIDIAEYKKLQLANYIKHYPQENKEAITKRTKRLLLIIGNVILKRIMKLFLRGRSITIEDIVNLAEYKYSLTQENKEAIAIAEVKKRFSQENKGLISVAEYKKRYC